MQVESAELSITPDILFYIGDFPVTNSMTSGILLTTILIIITFAITFRIRERHPNKLQIVFELLVEAFLGFLESIAGDRKTAMKILPIIGTVFVFIGLANIILLLIPILSAIEINGYPLFRTHTDDFNTTFSIALGLVFASHIIGMKRQGVLSYINKFFPIGTVIASFKKSIADGLISIIDVFVALLDIVSEFAKSLSMSLRLFGNMFAGDLLMSVFFSLFALVLPAAWTGMSLFTGAIQAIVFGALAASYIAGIMKETT